MKWLHLLEAWLFFTKWRILTLAYIKQKMVAWNIYKRKKYTGCTKVKGKAVAFHVMKPCIEFIQGFFLY